MGRTETLLEVVAKYVTDRAMIHNIVYYLEFITGKNTGYRNCGWRITSTGMYCKEIEEDIRKLVDEGKIVDTGKELLPADKEQDGRITVDYQKLIEENIEHFMELF